MHPATLALIVTALTVAGFSLYACWHGMRILSRWDLASGSELQLELERRTYLISTIMTWGLIFQLLSLFLFIYTADALHGQFTGAMCAAGTLNVSRFGYPLLLLKVVDFILAGVWLLLNHADSKGYDYPLIKVKYELLNLLTPLLVLEACLLVAYFSGVRPDVITSCCGSLFSHETRSFGGELAALPPTPMRMAFFASIGLTVVSAFYFRRSGRGGGLFAALGTLTFPVATAALVSVICLYIYELPSHHCPFCLLQAEYHHIGYLYYVALLGGAVSSLACGLLIPFRGFGSMTAIIPTLQKRLALAAMVCYLLLAIVAAWQILASNLELG